VVDSPSGGGELTGGTLVPNGGPILIAGNRLLSEIILGIDVIMVKPNEGFPWIYSYQVVVYGSAVGNTTTKLNFWDETGDSYGLSIMSPLSAEHAVNYNSDSPTIKRISWDRVPSSWV
jgi:predicted P-loop ATPase/GTPase